MHLPWTQIANEVMDHAAVQLAAAGGWHDDPDIGEGLALAGLVRLFRWARERCPNDRPPSASAVLPGPHAARLIARVMRYPGDPDQLVSVCEALSPSPILGRVAGGIRINGLDRYDAAWRKNYKEAADAWEKQLTTGGASPLSPDAPTAAPPTAPSVRKPGGNRAETGRKPGGFGPPDTDADADTEADPNPPPPALRAAPNVVPLRTPTAREEEDEGLWGFMQGERQKLGLTREEQPVDFAGWAEGALAEVGPGRLTAAYGRFLLDPDFRLRGWPMPVFQRPKVWRQRAYAIRDTS